MSESAAQAKTTASESGSKAKFSRKTLKALFRKKRKKLLIENKEFAKTYFDGKSKRSAARKLAFRKRHQAKAAGKEA